LIGRIRSSLGVEVTIRSLFEAPTVSGLAERLGTARPGRAGLARQVRPERLPLSYAQQRLWFLFRLEGPSPTYNIPIVLRLRGELDRGALEQALGDVVARHESLRTVFAEEGGVPWQQVLESAAPVLSVRAATEGEVWDLVRAGARHGFDLEREPPLRAELFELGDREHVLLLTVHHIAGDGSSLSPLARDLGRAYGARRRGAVPGWPELPVQYADYTLWQREVLGEETDPGSEMSRQLRHWREALRGLPEEIELPADRRRPGVSSRRGGVVPVRLDADLHRGLQGLARESGATLFMVLQAGLAALLSRLGAGEDIAIGSPVAGRTDAALEELVGFFVNTLVLRTDVSGDPSFRELLGRVRNWDLSAYAHQDLPFERLVEALNPTRSL
ncbi:condensation domain-containing protein, partial [Inquilinus sp. 2KB_12]